MTREEYYNRGKKICSVDGCGKFCCGRGKCQLHYKRECERRPIFTKRESFYRSYRPTGKTAYIFLSRDKMAIVDIADFDNLRKQTWTFDGRQYAVRGIKNSSISLHREIMQAKRGEYVDHINGNGLDNRRCNLRICTNAENIRNSRKHKASTSQYKGVHWNRKAEKWESMIRFNYKRKWLGTFDNEREAAIAYNRAATDLFGDFAFLNAV